MADPFAALNEACVATFGKQLIYQPASGEAFLVNGVLERVTDEERHAGAKYARLFVNLADFEVEPDHGDQVTVDAVTYTVFEVQADAVGGAWLSLRNV